MNLISKQAASIETSATLEITALAANLRAQGKNVIAFAAGEPDLCVPSEVAEAGIAAIRGGMGRYTSAAGLPDLRIAISQKFRRDGFPFGPDEVLVTSGGKPALYEAIFALIDHGDEVIFPAPYWGSYTEIVRVAGGVPVPLETCPENDFQPDAASLKKLITPRTRVLMLNSPNNPTGTVYSHETLQALAGVLRGTKIAVVSDDIYDCLVYTGEPYRNILHVAPDLADRTVVVNSFSKSHSMTGWRLGYAGGPKDLIRAIGNVQSQIVGNPPSIAQRAALTALAMPVDPSRAASLNARRLQLVKLLQEIPNLPLPVPRGAFYVFPSVRAYLGRKHKKTMLETATDLSRALLESKLVATVPGEAFGGPGHIRFTYTVTPAEITEGVARFREFLAEIS